MSQDRTNRAHLVYLAAAAGTCLVLLLGAAGYALRNARDAARAHTAEVLSNITLSVERDFMRSLRGYDILLRAVAEGLQTAEQPLNEMSQRLLFEEGTETLFGSIVVTDAAGMVTSASTRADLGLDLAETAYFREHASNRELGLVPGPIQIGRRTNRPGIPLSRRLADDGTGAFRGIAVGNVKLAYFNRAFTVYRLGKGGEVALLSLDGRLLAGTPFAAELAGRDFSASPVMQRLLSDSSGTFEALSQYDGLPRLYTARRLAGLPFYVVVGMSTTQIFADWNVRAWETVASVACFLLVVGLLCLVLRRELRLRAGAERVSAESAARLGLVADNMDDLVLNLDWEGRRRLVAGASRRLLGVDPSDLLERDSLEFVHPEDKYRLAAALAEMRSAGMPCQVTYRIRHRNGTWRNFEARGRALPDGSGAIIVARDATDRMELEARLRAAERVEAVGQITASVAHDFNNLLQTQTTALELLIEAARNDPGTAKYAAVAHSAGQKAAKLTNSLLAFSGRQILHPVAVDLPDLLGRIRTQTERGLDPGISLRIQTEEGVSPPMADPAQLEVALMHLCSNARDAMEHIGGPLVVEVYCGDRSEDRPDGVDGGECTVVAVSDEGHGMDQDTLVRACEPFFTTKEMGRGSGLGLSMVQGFVKQSGGELRVQSWPRVGTRAEMWLPRSTDHQVPARPRRRERQADEPGRVLLVDDDDTVRALLSTMLEDAGFHVTCAANGEAALVLLRSHAVFDVLVSDFAMDGMNGGHLIEQTRALHPLLPGLIITGYADAAALGQVPDDVDILCKPFQSDELVLRVATLTANVVSV